MDLYKFYAKYDFHRFVQNLDEFHAIVNMNKFAIFRLNIVDWCGNNLHFHFNPFVITFTFESPSKITSSSMFFPTCTTIITIWWFDVVVIIMMVALKLLSSPSINCWLVLVIYVFRFGANFNNRPWWWW